MRTNDNKKETRLVRCVTKKMELRLVKMIKQGKVLRV